MSNVINQAVSLLGMIEKDPSGITGFITGILGAILNVLFELSYMLSSPGSMAFSIIAMTVIVRIIMFPLGIKQQHSMAVTQHLQPEVAKIKKKYGDTKDPELQRKMNVEIQNLYSKGGANPILGCLPLLITLPIFIALFSLLKQSYLYVDRLNDLYTQIAVVLNKGMHDIPGLYDSVGAIVNAKLPKGMILNPDVMSELAKLVNKMSSANWQTLTNSFPDLKEQIMPLLNQKVQIESMFGINLIDVSGWSFPGIIIPVLTGLATLLTSIISMRQTRNTTEPSQANMQKYMMYGMPIMMIFMAAGASAGVGVYWTVSSLFQAGQSYLLGKYYNKERLDAYFAKREAKLKGKPAKKGTLQKMLDAQADKQNQYRRKGE